MNLSREQIRKVVLEEQELDRESLNTGLPVEYLDFLEFFTRDEVFNIDSERVSKFIEYLFKAVVKINAALATITFMGLPELDTANKKKDYLESKLFLDFISKNIEAVEMTEEESEEFIHSPEYLTKQEIDIYKILRETSLFSRNATKKVKIDIDKKNKKVTFIVERIEE